MAPSGSCADSMNRSWPATAPVETGPVGAVGPGVAGDVVGVLVGGVEETTGGPTGVAARRVAPDATVVEVLAAGDVVDVDAARRTAAVVAVVGGVVPAVVPATWSASGTAGVGVVVGVVALAWATSEAATSPTARKAATRMSSAPALRIP